MFFNPKDIIGVPTNLTLGGSPSYIAPQPSVLSEAFSAYSTKDLFSTNGNVINIYSNGSSPSSRDFTATELTDGTYSSWVASSFPTVATLYDQVGSINLTNGFNGTQPEYNSSDNCLDFHKGGFMNNYLALSSANLQTITDNFGGNDADDAVSFSLNAKTNSGNTGSLNELIFGVKDNAPYQPPINQRSKAMSMDQSDLKIGVRMRDQSYTIYTDKTNTAIASSFKNYAVTISAQGSGASFANNFNIYGNGSSEKSSSTSTMDSGALQVKSYSVGYGTFSSDVMLTFNKKLTDSEVSTLNTEMNAL